MRKSPGYILVKHGSYEMPAKKDARQHIERLEEIKLEMAEEALKFVKWDNSLNDELLKIMKVISEEVANNPGMLTDGSDALSAALRDPGNPKPDPSTDVTGGSDIGRLIDLIRGLLDPLGAEKDFFMDIIRLVFCGCGR